MLKSLEESDNSLSNNGSSSELNLFKNGDTKRMKNNEEFKKIDNMTVKDTIVNRIKEDPDSLKV